MGGWLITNSNSNLSIIQKMTNIRKLGLNSLIDIDIVSNPNSPSNLMGIVSKIKKLK